MGATQTSANMSARAQSWQRAREYTRHHVARLQQVINTLKAAHAELQKSLMAAVAKWEQAAGRTYDSMGSGRCLDIEMLKQEIADHQVQIATAQIMLSEGSSRGERIKRGVLRKLEDVLMQVIPLAGHLTAEQIVSGVNIEFDWAPGGDDGVTSLQCNELLDALMDVDTEATAGSRTEQGSGNEAPRNGD